MEDAQADQLSFVSDERYLPLISELSRRQRSLFLPPSNILIALCSISPQPYLAMARAAQLFCGAPVSADRESTPVRLVGDDVHLGERGGHRSAGPSREIAAGSVRGPESTAGPISGGEVEVGDHCLIYPGVTVLDRCRIGNRVIIHSGTVIGSDGFGFAQDEKGRHVKIPQVGIVQIDDDVEIGANCTIDRAAFGRTWIQRGTKIDNLVQIAHNVVIGEHSILIAQVGISGSTRVGKHVILAGQVGVVGHIEIGDGARVGAQSGVGRSVKAGEDVSGSPVMPHKEWLKMVANVKRLPQLKEELRQLKTEGPGT